MAQGAGLRVRLAVEWLACASRADRGEVRRVEGGREVEVGGGEERRGRIWRKGRQKKKKKRRWPMAGGRKRGENVRGERSEMKREVRETMAGHPPQEEMPIILSILCHNSA